MAEESIPRGEMHAACHKAQILFKSSVTCSSCSTVYKMYFYQSVLATTEGRGEGTH